MRKSEKEQERKNRRGKERVSTFWILKTYTTILPPHSSFFCCCLFFCPPSFFVCFWNGSGRQMSLPRRKSKGLSKGFSIDEQQSWHAVNIALPATTMRQCIHYSTKVVQAGFGDEETHLKILLAATHSIAEPLGGSFKLWIWWLQWKGSESG